MMKINLMNSEERRGNNPMKSEQLPPQPSMLFFPALSQISEKEFRSPMDEQEADDEKLLCCIPGSELAEASESSGPNKILF